MYLKKMPFTEEISIVFLSNLYLLVSGECKDRTFFKEK